LDAPPTVLELRFAWETYLMTDRVIGCNILSSTFVTEKILGISSLFCAARYATYIVLSMIVLDWEAIY
jgi:hypothetical protein